MLKKFSLVLFFILILGNFNPQPSFGAGFNNVYRSDEILVKFKNGAFCPDGAKQLENLEICVIKLLPGEEIDKAIKYYENRSDVEFVEPNYFIKVQFEPVTPIDPDFAKQWYLKKVNAPSAWARTTGSQDVVIAVLDTGLDLDHPDIADNLYINEREIPDDGIDNDGNIYVDDVNGWDFVDGDNNPNPNFDEWYSREGINHGTVVAGIAAAVGNNGHGIAGVTWHSKIMPLRVLDGIGSGDVLSVIEAIDYAVEKNVSVINLSFVGVGFSKSLFLSLERAYDSGILVVAAAGNERYHGQDLDVSPVYPVCYYGQEEENVILGVAALDKDDKKTAHSNYGSKCVDISAPGVDFWSTQVQNYKEPGFENYYGGGWSGTSVSAPLVSGTAALVKSLNPNLKVNEIRNLIVVNSDPIDGLNPDYAGKLGKGRLNMARTVEAAYLTRETLQQSSRGLILTGPFKNYSPLVKVLNEDGSLVKSLNAYSESFLGGVNVAAGDINGDGTDEIITGAGTGGGPHVRIFKQDGTVLGGFFAYAKEFRGGVNVAAGDINGDGTDEIITGAGTGGGPEIRVFNLKGNLIDKFFAFEPEFRGGVNVAAGDIDKDSNDEIIISMASGGSKVRVFGQYLVLKSEFLVYENFSGGVSVATGDIEGDGKSEIIVGPGPGSSLPVKVFNAKGFLRSQFLVYGQDYKSGIKTGFLSKK